MNSVRGRESGNIVLVLLFAVMAIFASFEAATSIGAFGLSQSASQSSALALVEAQRASLARALEDPEALTQTIYAPENAGPLGGGANLQRCISDPRYDCPRGSHDLLVYGQTANQFAAIPNAIAGSNFFGFGLNSTCTDARCARFVSNYAVCDSFQAVGNVACPARYHTTWAPICVGAGKCFSPQIMLQADLEMPVKLWQSMPVFVNVTRFQIKRPL